MNLDELTVIDERTRAQLEREAEHDRCNDEIARCLDTMQAELERLFDELEDD